MAMVMQLQAMALKKAVQEDKISQEKAQAQLSEVQDRFKQLVHEYQDTQEDAESLAWLAELARVLDMFGPFMQMYLNAPFGRMAVPASVRVAQGDPAMAGKGDFAAIFQQFKDSGIPLKTYITAVLGALGVNETLGILSVGTAPNAPWGENVPPKLREEVEGVESNVALQLGLQALQFGF
jgi:hypothetical protein